MDDLDGSGICNNKKEPLIESEDHNGGADDRSLSVTQQRERSPPSMQLKLDTSTERHYQRYNSGHDKINNFISVKECDRSSKEGHIAATGEIADTAYGGPDTGNGKPNARNNSVNMDIVALSAANSILPPKTSPSAQLQAECKQNLMEQHTKLPAYKRNAPNPMQGEPSRSRDEEENCLLVHTKIPGSKWEKFRAIFFRSGLIYFLVFLVTVASMVYGVSDKFGNAVNPFRSIDWDREISVAFIGNAYFFVNDVPRLLEAVSTGHVYQNSVLHAGGSLKALWQTGNGMYEVWQTDEALIEVSTGTDDDYTTQTTYDFGLCTVAQILQGYDEYIGYGNPYGRYKNDGLNPCLVNKYYASIVEAELERDPIQWNYVILTDQTKRMAVVKARNDTVQVLTGGYGPFLKASGAIPVIVDTHAFWSEASNMTGLTDIPTFTSLIREGAKAYVDALANLLPRKQSPLVAPIGLAYLTVWEENYDLWQLLFLEDQIHSSAAGSYLFVHVLYCTLFGHMPADDERYTPPQVLFQDARKMLGEPYYPSTAEAEYLRDVAKRVTLRGYVPQSLYGEYDNGGRKQRR